MLLAVFKKAPAYAGAFFVPAFLCIFLSIATPSYGSGCQIDKTAGPVQIVKLKYVVDGDTVRLKDGRKVRLSAINAPEIAHDDRPEEPFGDEAKSLVEKLLKGRNELQMQVRGKDRYGRTLGLLFTPEGALLAADVLRQGMAFQIFMDKPDRYTECLQRQEKKAREQGLGVWGLKAVTAVKSNKIHGGFMVVRGQVRNILTHRSSSYTWLEMDGNLMLSLPNQLASKAWLDSVKGKTVEARGWVVDRSNKKKQKNKSFKRWMMLINQTQSVVVQ